MEDAEYNLRHNVFWRDQVDVVTSSDILKFDIPLSQFFGGQVKAGFLMSNVMVLAENTA